ncbi:glycosyltransferase family 2 protein [Selenomonas ruminantium]|uniref:Glycosyltransferase, GT2 family n=1 Tax=Selenomonas ruminantium TaxID=971 RepID=A0A1I0YIF2_SELRU|nr:glycosyltransferase [Selenomonas ruminantium]SFB12128.1 Glycosyltransferase, GT2 family [Selenomonas ruminantium]
MEKKRILENINICREALDYIQSVYDGDNDTTQADLLLKDVQMLLYKTISVLQDDDENELLIPNAVICARNTNDSIDRMFRAKDAKKYILHYEILESFSRLSYLLDYQYNILDDKNKLQAYRERLIERLKEHHNIEPNEHKYKYKVSIVVRAYNKLEYTKRAVESIYKYTNFEKNNVELITINNGSTDRTEEYFATLPNKKKINFKHNMLGMSFRPPIPEGQYCVEFSNDAVATPNWLDQLLICIESSSDIAVVVPTCNEDAISNHQGIRIPYSNSFTDMDKMLQFAQNYNRTNPRLWEEVSRIMPFVAIWRSDVWSLGIEDPIYTEMQFIDDDYSTLLRRTGWKMILARDTFLHHFGSITFKHDGINSYNKSIEKMRWIYFSKWGIDAWRARGNFEEVYPIKLENVRKIRILWVEPKDGGGYLQVKNQCMKHGVNEVYACAMLTDMKYMDDARHIFDDVVYAQDIHHTLDKIKEKYDYIGMGTYLHEVTNDSTIDLLMKLRGLLNPLGRMVIPLKNSFNLEFFIKYMKNNGEYLWGEVDRTIKVFNLKKFLNAINKAGFGSVIEARRVLTNYWDDDLEIICRLKTGNCSIEENKLEMQTIMMWLMIPGR